MKIESEKLLERKLNLAIKKLGGCTIKLLATHISGLPDRICLLPQGKVFFAEVKTTKEKPKKIQLKVHRDLKAMNFPTFIIQSTEDIENLIKNL